MQHSSRRAPVKAVPAVRSTRMIDSMAYLVGVGGNLAVVPQIIRAWQDKAPGLAVLTWLLFVGIGLIWLVYAVHHKQKPLIVAQITGIMVNLAVVMGWCFHTLF